MCREGARVAFTGRRKELGAALVARLGADSVLFVEADHARSEECARCVQATLAAFGTIDILFNNAGLSYAHLPTTAEGRLTLS